MTKPGSHLSPSEAHRPRFPFYWPRLQSKPMGQFPSATKGSLCENMRATHKTGKGGRGTSWVGPRVLLGEPNLTSSLILKTIVAPAIPAAGHILRHLPGTTMMVVPVRGLGRCHLGHVGPGSHPFPLA